MPNTIEKIQVIDSHTGGEPTRVVICRRAGFGHGASDRTAGEVSGGV